MAASKEGSSNGNQGGLAGPIKRLLALYEGDSENEEIRRLLMEMESIAERVDGKTKSSEVAGQAASTGVTGSG
ncbi:MAG TPA: hypothetical protein V6D08_04860 [Candidatus Obscuribacterales bacterium]